MRTTCVLTPVVCSVVYTLPMMHWASSYTTTHRRTLHGGYHKHGW